MKGVVYVELLELLDDLHSMEFTEQGIEEAGVVSGGAYNALGQFDDLEFVALTGAYQHLIGHEITEELYELCERVVRRCILDYPRLFPDHGTLPDTLERMESLIYLKGALYETDTTTHPDYIDQISPNQMVLNHHGDPHLTEFTAALIHGCAAHHHIHADVHCLPVNQSGTHTTRYLITLSEIKHGRLGSLQTAV